MRSIKHLHLALAGGVLGLALSFTSAFASNPYAHFAGTYSSAAPDTPDDPSSPAGPAFSVSLGPDGSATVTQDAGKGAITTFGHWTDAGSGVTIKFDDVEGKTTEAPMSFQTSHDGLQATNWNHNFWGKTTPPPLKKEESNWHANKKHAHI